MKKHIKIKVKTLIVILVVSITLISSESLYWQGIKLYNSVAPDQFKLSLRDMSTSSLKSENQRLKLIYKENNYLIFMLAMIENGYMINGMRLSSLDANNIYDTFLLYSEQYNLYEDYPTYVINVALAQWFSGNSEGALETLDKFDDETHLEDVHIVKSGMYLGLYQFDKVLESLSKVQSTDYSATKENILFYLNNMFSIPVADDQLKNFETSASYFDPKVYKGEFSQLFSNLYAHNLDTVKGNFQSLNNEGTLIDRPLSGKVTINSLPVSGAFIYEKTDRGMHVTDYIQEPIHITDEKGTYKINQIHDDFVGLGIAISWHLIHDQQLDRDFYEFYEAAKYDTYDFHFFDGVKFKSLKIENNKLYYEIQDPHYDSNRAYRIRAKHTDPKYDLNAYASSDEITSNLKGSLSLEALRSNSNFAFSFSSSQNELSIERFIEPLYLEGLYSFEVLPYYPNKNDKYIINGFFSDTLSLYMRVQGQTSLSKGDEMLSKGKIDQAIKWYDEDRSMHSLRVLTALYSKGYSLEAQMDHWQKLGGANPEKAIHYTKLQLEKFGQNQQLLLDLARLYQDSMNFEQERNTYQKLLDLDPTNEYIHESYAYSLIRLGHYMQGLDYLEEHSSRSRSYAFKENLLLLGNIDEGLADPLDMKYKKINHIDTYTEFHAYIQQGEYEKAKFWLDAKPDSDLKTMYHLLLEDTFGHLYPDPPHDDFVTYYRESVFQIKDEKISELLQELKKYNNWF